MAVQIINPTPDWATALGAGVGQGFANTGNLLSELALHKVKSLADRETSFTRQKENEQALIALGYTPQEASMLKSVPDATLNLLVKQKLEAPQQALMSQGLAKLYGANQSLNQPIINQPSAQPPVTPPLGSVTPVSGASEAQAPITQQPAIQNAKPSLFKDINDYIDPNVLTNLTGKNREAYLKEAYKVKANDEKNALKAAGLEQAATLADKKNAMMERISIRKLELQEKLATAKNEFEREKLQRKIDVEDKRMAFEEAKFKTQEERIEQHAIDKETKSIYDTIRSAAKAATESDKRLDRMEQINEKESPSRGFEALRNTLEHLPFGLKIDLNFLRSASAEEFEKLSADFIKDAKTIFGNRLTDADLNAFLKTVPTLAQSQEGRRRIITNLRSFNAAAKARDKAMYSILKETGGKRPWNLEQLIDEKISPELNRLAADFVAGKDIKRNQEKIFATKPERTFFEKVMAGPGAFIGNY